MVIFSFALMSFFKGDINMWDSINIIEEETSDSEGNDLN